MTDDSRMMRLPETGPDRPVTECGVEPTGEQFVTDDSAAVTLASDRE
ncbi:hypothetical protein [Glaciihabitans sp. INWT7]|nr:hypothetical protein [Glaciihabitans sp. INWT7]